MLSKKLNKSSGSVTDHGCAKEDYKIESVQEYLNCSKIVFELRLNEQMKRSSYNDFILHQSIGEGAYGRVMLVHHKSNENVFFAMKVMKKEQILRKNQFHNVLNEKMVLSAIRHPFIIHMEFYATNVCHIYFIMPFMVGGDLFSLISKKSAIDELSAKFYAGQMVLALEYLHMLDIIHRDLKPENILISNDGYIKLTDLGLSKRISKNTRTMCGTPQYIAPEVILLKAYGKSVDWWSLGIVMFEMVAGNVPFYDDNQRKLFKKILAGSYKMPEHFSDNFSDITKNLLQTDSKKRYGSLSNGIADIKLHRWFKTMDWIALYNKQMEVPFKPIYNSPSDTLNFDKFEDENIEDDNFPCLNVDQKYFENF